jgi:2-dehydro-3-deoxygluconokinase
MEVFMTNYNEKKYMIACPTSMGVRLTPDNRMAVHNSNHFYMQATSAETNVLNIASSLGSRCLCLTKFVQGSPIAAFIKNQLRARNIFYEGIEVPQDGPWGYRHQFNIADSGFGLRAPRVWNDRAGEVGRTICIDDFDTTRIFGSEGVGILHISGLIVAMSPETTRCCLELAKVAKQYGTLVSFDLNYRATFWKGRETELADAFHQIASMADVLVGNEEDFQLCLSFSGPEAGGRDLGAQIESFKIMITQAKEKYPGVKVFANTLRQVMSANEHLWGAIMLTDDQWFIEEPRLIQVLDRIGGGDGFTGGLLYGILKGWEPLKWLQFAWATGVMAATSLNDYAEPADEKQVWDVYVGNARVQR